MTVPSNTKMEFTLPQAPNIVFNTALILQKISKRPTHKCGGAGACGSGAKATSHAEDAVCVTPLDFYAGAREGLISIVCVCYCLFLCARAWMGSTALSLSHEHHLYALVRLMETSLGVHSAWLPAHHCHLRVFSFDHRPLARRKINFASVCLLYPSVPRAASDNEAHAIIILQSTKTLMVQKSGSKFNFKMFLYIRYISLFSK